MLRIPGLLRVSALLFSSMIGGHAAAEIGDTQTFSDGGTPVISDAPGFCVACVANGWSFNSGGVALDAGEDGLGDHALFYDAGGFGFHLLTWDGYPMADTDFLGNFVDAKVVAVRFRARHSGIGDSVVLRAYLFDTFDDGTTDWAISNGWITIENAGTGITWQTYTISLRASDLESGDFLGTPPTVTEVLSGVAQFGLRHDPNFTGPGTPARTISAVYFDDIQLILDDDGDGVSDGDDFCPGTLIPEGVPPKKLNPNHWALIDSDSEFDTVIKGKGKGPNRSYNVEDTAGCSCEQIIEAQGLGKGPTKHGCSIGVMDNWVELVNP